MVSKRSGRELGRSGPLETHKTLILGQENGDASIDFADSEGDEHVWLEENLMVGCALRHRILVMDYSRPEWD